MPSACVVFEFDTIRDANIVYSAVLPEVKQRISKTRISLGHTDKKIILDISSEDVSALRAACNSFLRWVATVVDVKELG